MVNADRTLATFFVVNADWALSCCFIIFFFFLLLLLFSPFEFNGKTKEHHNTSLLGKRDVLNLYLCNIHTSPLSTKQS